MASVKKVDSHRYIVLFNILQASSVIEVKLGSFLPPALSEWPVPLKVFSCALQVYKSLEDHPYWLHIVDWIENMEKQQSNVSRHPEFEWVDRTIHDLLSGIQSSQSQVCHCPSSSINQTCP